MKFSIKIILFIGMLTLCLTLASGVSAQNSSVTSVNSPTTNTLNSVSMIYNTTQTNNDLTALNAWAVGDNGTAISWNGTAWSSANTSTTTNLYSVCMVNNSIGWAVGGGANNGIILRYNGTGWSQFRQISFGTNPAAQDTINSTLYAVTLNENGTVGWAVGAGGTVLAWDNQTWYGVANVTNGSLFGVGMIHDSTNVWAVGENGTIIMWNGFAWNNMTSSTNVHLYDIEMINATSGWAVGGNATSGVILTLNGTTWRQTTNVTFTGSSTGGRNDRINSTLFSISMDNPSSAWTVGGNGTVLYWNGIIWNGQTDIASGVTFRGVAMVHGTSNNSTQAWAVGSGGRIFAWTGNVWIPEIPLILAAPIALSIGVAVALYKRTKLRMLLLR